MALTLQQSAVLNWRRNHKVDSKLLQECAYYPKGGCQHCSWDHPNPNCNRSHILIDTRINPGEILPPLHQPPSPKNKRKTLWGVSVEELLKRFPKGLQDHLLKIMAET